MAYVVEIQSWDWRSTRSDIRSLAAPTLQMLIAERLKFVVRHKFRRHSAPAQSWR
jgi:hypothetical protein